jgi:hypothetical protein
MAISHVESYPGARQLTDAPKSSCKNILQAKCINAKCVRVKWAALGSPPYITWYDKKGTSAQQVEISVIRPTNVFSQASYMGNETILEVLCGSI